MLLLNLGIHEFIDLFVGTNQVEQAKSDYKHTVLVCLGITRVVALVCVGIMYLRFRVF